MQTINGDVRNPIGIGNKFICHVVNNDNKMGSGVALALLQKWNSVKSEYHSWANNDPDTFILGNVQLVWVENDIGVINMIGQNGIKSQNNPIPLKYDAFTECLRKSKYLAKKHNATIHIPWEIGSNRAGGNWIKVQEIINNELKGIDVTIYKFEE